MRLTCLLLITIVVLFVQSCKKEASDLKLDDETITEELNDSINSRDNGLLSDSLLAKPSASRLNLLWADMMSEATVDDIGGFLYQNGLFEWSVAKIVKEFGDGKYIMSVPTIKNDSISSILFVYSDNNDYSYWHIQLSELENDTQVLLDQYGSDNLLISIFAFLQYEQVLGIQQHNFLNLHLAHPTLGEALLEIVPRGWCLIEMELYTENQSLDAVHEDCNCNYFNQITQTTIFNPPSDFNPSEDDPTWQANNPYQDYRWTIVSYDADGNIIHGQETQSGTTVYHFWAWCPDEMGQAPWS